MLEKEDLDIVSVCSPTEFHLDAFKAIGVTNSVKGVFCEKPLSYSFEDSINIVRLSKNKIISLNYFRRWNPSFKKLKNDLDKGTYGVVRHVSVRYTKGLMTNGSHFLDLLCWFFGNVVEYDCYKIYDKNSIDSGVDFRVGFGNRVNAVFSHIPSVPYVYIEVDILTAKGKLSITQRGQKITWSSAMKDPSYNTFNMLKNGKTIETKWKDCPTRAISELVDAIKYGKGVSCNEKDGILVSEICNKLLTSHG